jgi:hypothetical protein
LTVKIGRPVKYVRFSNSVIFLLPECYGSFRDSFDNRDCDACPVYAECRAKKPSITRNA